MEVKLRKEEIIEKIRAGAIFIHPTDTIYGIGCNAEDEKAVKKIREIKERQDNPFSVWVPSKEWVKENCIGDVKKLCGSCTLIVELKNKKCVAKNVNLGSKTLGIRSPDHWFGKIIEEAGVPVVTTSANKAGRPFMTDLRNLDKEIENQVDFIIFEGEKHGRPSKIVDLSSGEVKER